MDIETGDTLELGWDPCRMWDEGGKDVVLGMCRFEKSWDEMGRGAGLVLGLGFDQGQGRVPSLVGWGARTLVGQVAELKRWR